MLFGREPIHTNGNFGSGKANTGIGIWGCESLLALRRQHDHEDTIINNVCGVDQHLQTDSARQQKAHFRANEHVHHQGVTSAVEWVAEYHTSYCGPQTVW